MAIVFSNNARTTLASGISSSATSITVTDGSVFPSLTGNDIFYCTIDDGTNNEIVKVTAISSNTLTVVRAQDNTTANAFVTGDLVELRLVAAVLDTFSQLDAGEVTADEFIGDLRGAVIFKAQAGEAVSKGDAVYVSGISGTTPIVALADADFASKMPAFGLVLTTASLNGSTEVVTFGTISSVNTSAFSLGDTLYVSTTAGALTNSKPTGESSLIQNIGKVQRSHASAGSIKVGGAGRSNDTPNLNDGNIFIGNASNQATTASLNTKIEDYLDANGTTFPDNVKAQFGTSNDLQIYHDGTHSYIDEVGTGGLNIRSNGGRIALQKNDGTFMIEAINNGNVVLYSNGQERLRANGTGIDVTGTIVGDGLTVDGNTTLNTSSTLFANLNYLGGTRGKLTTNGIDLNIEATSNLFLKVNSATRAKFDGNGDISFYEDTGTTAKFFWDASAESLGIGTTPSEKLHVLTTGNTVAKYETSLTSDLAIELKNSQGSMFFGLGGGEEFAVGTTSDLNGSGNLFAIKQDGSVGIGTVNPSQPLHVDASGGGVVRVTRLGNSASAYGQLEHDGTNTTLTSSAQLIFNSGGSEAMRLDSSQNATFTGTISSANIDVTGASGGNGQITVARTSGSTVAIQSQSARGLIGTSTNHPFRLMSNGTQRIELDTNGNFNLLSGALEINGTTVIDSSRNLTNIGTINSGATTASGDIASRQSAYPGGRLILDRTASSSGAMTSSEIHFRAYGNNTTLRTFGKIEGRSTGYTDGQIMFYTQNSGTLTEALTIDSSQNATFAGAITSTGTSSFGVLNSSGNIRAGNGSTTGNVQFTSSSYQISGGSGVGDLRFVAPRFRFYEDNTSGTAEFEIDGGNATFTGTISSGAITSSGIITSATTGTANAKVIADGGGAANIEIDRGSTSYHNNLLYRTAGAVKWRIWQSGADNVLAVRNEVAGTNVLSFTDTNSTFAGTINSGAITSTGEVEATALDINGNGDISGNLTLGGYLAGPATFTIDPAAVGDNTGTVVIAGNLQVDGTTTTVNSTTVNVSDKNITLGYDATTDAANNQAGIIVYRPETSNAQFLWNETSERFEINRRLNISQHFTVDASGTNDTMVEIGSGTASNHYAYIDLIGDATYTDYGLRIIRNNGGANTNSQIVHRGTGNFSIQATDSASVKIRTASQDALTIDSSQNATFAGTISSGAITSSGDIKAAGDLWVNYDSSGNDYLNLNYATGGDGGILFRHSNALKWQFGATTGTGNNLFWYSYPASQTVMSLTTSGLLSTDIGYQVNGTTVIDSSRNLTNIGTISSGSINSGAIDSLTSSADIPTGSTANLYLVDTRSLAANTGGSIVFSSYYQGTNAVSGGSYIKGYKENANSGDYGYGLKFGVRQNGQGSTGPVFTLNSSGNATFTGTISSGAITSSGDLAIDTDTLFVDVSTDRVGINNNSPSYPLDFPINQSGLAIRVGDDNVDSYMSFSNPRGFVGFDASGYMTLQGGNSKGVRLNVNTSTFGDGAALTIDTSGNATFSGTISSGAITSSGNINTTSTSMGVTQSDGDYLAKLYQAGSDGKLELYTGQATPTSRIKLDAYYDNYINPAAGGLAIGKTTVGSGLELDVAGAIGISGTTVIDASRNLTNIASANIGGGTSYFSEKLLVNGRTRVAGQLDIALGSGYSNYGTLNHDDSNFTIAVNRVSGTGNINLAPYGNVNITSGGLQINGTTVINSSREIQNVTFNNSYYTDEYGKSLVGNFGQFQAHSTYTDFNTNVSMWGWNFVQGNGNNPVGISAQWYRQRISLGDAYGYGTDSGDYWMELALPRYGNGVTSNSSSNLIRSSLWVRTCEGGSIKSWSQIGGDLYNGLSIRGTDVIDSSRNLTNIGTISSGAITVNGAETITSSRALYNLSGDIRSDNVFSFITQATAAQSIKAKSLYVGTTYGGNTPSNGMVQASVGFAVGTGAGGTTVIDSSRNLTNIGTLNTTAFWTTSAATSHWGASGAVYGTLTWDTGYASIYGASGAELRLGSSGGQDKLTVKTDGNVTINGGALQMSDTTVIDSSRNLTNIAGITSTGAFSNTSSTKAIFGAGSGANQGIDIKYGSGGSDYSAIRFYSNYVNNSTIHVFSTAWQGGSFTGASAGAINIEGTYGVTFGAWNSIDAYIQRTTGDTYFRGNLQVGDYSGSHQIEIASGGNTAGYLRFNDLNNTEGSYVRSTGATGSTGGDLVFGSRWNTDTDRIYMEMTTTTVDTPNALFKMASSSFMFGGNNNGKESNSAQISAGQHQSNSLNFVGMSSGTTSSDRRMDFWVEGGAYFRGNLVATGNVTAYGSTSDKRLKKDIVKIDNAIDKIKSVSGYEFAWNENAPEDKQDKREFGVIAQEVEEAGLDKLVFEYERPVSGTDEDNKDLPDEKWKAVHYDKFVPILIEAIKEQQKEIEYMKSEIKTLKENKNGD